MPYVLGIDVGTTHTAAAVCRLDDPAGDEVENLRLGDHSDTVGSLLYLEQDGSPIVGAGAARRALADHRRVARGFVGRVGDAVPMVVGGQQYLAQDLAAALVGWVVEQARIANGAPPEHIVVTHPASWGPYRCDLLRRALQQFGLGAVTLLPRPVAIAEHHAVTAAPCELLAVYDVGSDPVQVSVLARRNEGGPFRLLATAQSPGSEPALAVDTLVRTVRSAAHPRPLDAVLLAGLATGSRELEPVAEQVRAQLPVPVVPDTHPELAVARGAAVAARRVLRPAVAPRPAPGSRGLPATADGRDDVVDRPPPRPPVRVSPLELPQRRSVSRLLSGRPVVLGALSAAVAATGVSLTLLFFTDDEPQRQSTSPPTVSRTALVPQPVSNAREVGGK